MKHAFLLLGGILLMFASGCATLLRGDKQSMKFETDPPGATLTIDGIDYKTPVVVALKRKEEHSFTISKEGYRTIKVPTMKPTWDGASIPGFLLPGGSVSLAADRASGADLNFYDLPVIKLEPANSDTPPLILVQYRKKLMTQEDYDKLMEQEKEAQLHSREED